MGWGPVLLQMHLFLVLCFFARVLLIGLFAKPKSSRVQTLLVFVLCQFKELRHLPQDKMQKQWIYLFVGCGYVTRCGWVKAQRVLF